MSSNNGFNFGLAYNRPQDYIAPYTTQQIPSANPIGASGVDYTDYGYIPGVAQAAQKTAVPPRSLNPQPAFSLDDLNIANWFTTRVHLSPLGKVQ